MASPLRFRISEHDWGEGQFERRVLAPLEDKFGASVERTDRPEGYEGRVLRMGNGDVALFAWRKGDGNGSEPGAYWMGNTETPEVLWNTTKRCFDEVPSEVAEWAHMEYLEALTEEAPWTAGYPRLAGFFLPVLMAKDGRGATRDFLRSGAGIPGVEPSEALGFYEDIVSSGVFEGSRYVMASKLGTSDAGDRVRMEAAMAEFNAAKVLHDSGHEVEPEVGTDTGHSLDFLARKDGRERIVEVTRPVPPSRRGVSSPVDAVRETAGRKTGSGEQLDGNDAVLFVDCTSFDDDEWREVVDARPDVGHEPAVVYRTRPSGTEAYLSGNTRLRLSDAVDWLA